LYGTITTLSDALPGITKSKCLSSLVIVSDNAKCNGSRYLTYKQRIWMCSVVTAVFELLVTGPDVYEIMLFMDKFCITITGNCEDTFYIKCSTLFDDLMCYAEGEKKIVSMICVCSFPFFLTSSIFHLVLHKQPCRTSFLVNSRSFLLARTPLIIKSFATDCIFGPCYNALIA
jgi:hypothetical protein